MKRPKPAAGGLPPRNAMSVDVEEWFQVQAFRTAIGAADWDVLPWRIEATAERVLEIFARSGVRATFFTLGWIAARHPALVRRIVDAGHELASHGSDHGLVHELGEAGFRADVRRAKRVLEDAGGTAVAGYRAPTFSITAGRTPWAHAVLADEGYGYSSSVFPIRHDLYGAPGAPRGPHRPDPGGVVELPMSTVSAFGRILPCSGGGWFRLAPYPVFRAGLRRINAVEGRSGIFYFHPWELDAGQPRVRRAPRLSRFRHYSRLGSMAGRLERLLQDFAWGRVDEVFADRIGAE